MKRSFPIPAVFCLLFLASCESADSGAGRHYDHAADNLHFARPTLASIDAFPGVPHIDEAAQARLKLQRAFFARDFAVLESAVARAHLKNTGGQTRDKDVKGLDASFDETRLAGVDACADWLAARPDSYPAHLICGRMWRSAAWAARTGETADKVTPIRFALMRERLVRSNALLEKALALDDKPVEALTLLADNLFLLRDKDRTAALLRQAESIAPTYVPLHETRLRNARPEWGGSREEVAEAMAHAKEAGMDDDWLRLAEDAFVVRPWELSNPGAERSYWEKALAAHASNSRQAGLTRYLSRTGNWRETLPAASRMIARAPGGAEGYRLRAHASEMLGDVHAALRDYRMAAALGDDEATEKLIRAHIAGGMGLPAGDWNTLDRICRYGAALGLASAANCLGSAYWEGDRVGGPFHKDIAQSFSWHLLASRAGHANSQYDLGWLLLTNRAPGVDADTAKTSGLFWLRRAAENEHQFARKKLEEGGFDELESLDEEEDRAWPAWQRHAVNIALRIAGIIF